MSRQYSSGEPNPKVKEVTLLTTWGSEAGGPGESEFDNPSAIACDYEGNVVVADTGNHRVMKLDGNGKTLWVVGGTDSNNLPQAGTAQGEFRSPQAVCTDREDNIYVADTQNSRVQKLSPDGDLITVFGAWGIEKGQFGGEGPMGVTVDDHGEVLVSDTHTATGGNHRVLRFDPDGDYIGQFGSYGTGPGQFGGAMPVRQYGFDFGPGIGPGPIGPAGIVVNTSTELLLERNNRYGDIFVADCDNDRVNYFQGSEKPLAALGIGTVYRPRQVDLDSQDRLYVSGVHRHEPAVSSHHINDPMKWRVEPGYCWVWILDTRGMFGPFGTVLGGLGTPETHDSLDHELGGNLHSHGYGLAVGKVDDGIVYVQGGNRIFTFRVEWESKEAVR